MLKSYFKMLNIFFCGIGEYIQWMSTVDIQYKLIIIKLFWIIFNKDVIPDCACIIFICVNVIEWARFGDACSKFNDKASFRLYAIKNHVAWIIHRRLFLVLKCINQFTWILHWISNCKWIYTHNHLVEALFLLLYK